MKKRILASLLSLCLTVWLLPTVALAAEDAPADNPPAAEEVTCTETKDCPAEEHTEQCPRPVQAQIDALPDADSITAENMDEVSALLEAIDAAKTELLNQLEEGTELSEVLDFTRYDAVSNALTLLEDGEETPEENREVPADMPASEIAVPQTGSPVSWTSSDGTVTGSGNSVAEAVNALNAAKGGTIELSGDTYLGTSTVEVTSDITIVSAGTTEKPVTLFSGGKDGKGVTPYRMFDVSAGTLTFGAEDAQEDSLVIDLTRFSQGSDASADEYKTDKCGAVVCDGESGKVILNDGVKFTRTEPEDEVKLAFQTSAVNVLSGCLEINGGKIEGLQGRGVLASGAASKIVMNAGIITRNQKGGVRVWDGASFVMHGGLICGNKTSLSGGGVYVNAKSTLEVDGGTICDNYAEVYGGGIYAACPVVTIQKATISNNTAEREGGGICYEFSYSDYYDWDADVQPTVTIQNCEISGNSVQATNAFLIGVGGGGLSLGRGVNLTEFPRDIKVTVKDCRITDNFSDSGGGGMRLGPQVNAVICGDTVIADNAAASLGGGIVGAGDAFNESGTGYGTLTIEGNTVIRNNCSAEGGNIASAVGGVLTIGGNAKVENGTAVLGGGVLAGTAQFTLTDQAVIQNNRAYVGAGCWLGPEATSMVLGGNAWDGTVQMTGGSITRNIATADLTEENGLGRLSVLLEKMNSTAYPDLKSYLADWVTICEKLGISSPMGGGVFVTQNTFSITGGSITNNTADMGGGVAVYNCYVKRYGTVGHGKIDQEYKLSGSLTMSGGEICGNSARVGGGIYVVPFVNLFTEEELEEFIQDYDGEVTRPLFYDAAVYLEGGKITGNTAAEKGGGVYLPGTGRVILKDAPYVQGNTVNGAADNVWLDYDAEKAASFWTEEQKIKVIYSAMLEKVEDNPYKRYYLYLIYPEKVDEDALNYFRENGSFLDIDLSGEDALTALKEIFQSYNEELNLKSVYDQSKSDPDTMALLGLDMDCDYETFRAAYLKYALKEGITLEYIYGYYYEIAEQAYQENPTDENKAQMERWVTLYNANKNGEEFNLYEWIGGARPLEIGQSFLSIQGALSEGAKIGVRSQVPVTGRVVAEPFGGYTITKADRAYFSDDTAEYSVEVDSDDLNKNERANELVLNKSAAPDKPVEPEEPDKPVTPETPSKPSEDSDSGYKPGEGPNANKTDAELDKERHEAYVYGYPDRTVQPEGNITREEVATIFFRLLTDSSRAKYITDYNPFPDVENDRWSHWSITTLNNAGIMTGRNDGNFDPGAPITRAELAVVASQFSQAVYNGEDKFSDITDHWARDYINDAASEGWVSGYPDGTFGPDRYITRAEVMALINEVLERMPDKDHMLSDMIQWPDNASTSAWYYEDVQEATNSHDYNWITNSSSKKTGEDWVKITQMRPYADLVNDAWSGK